jgi:ankyrin repeat protein
MTVNRDPNNLQAADVLRRYKEEELPAFVEIPLEDVNQVGNFGDRPLHVASIRGNMDEIAALVAGGADVNAPGDLGNTPLHEAVSQEHIPAIEFLLNNGAFPSIKNEFGQTPLDIAREKGRRNIIELLERASRS